MSRTRLILVVLALALVAVWFYGSRDTTRRQQASSTHAGGPATAERATRKPPNLSHASPNPTPTEAELDPRKRSLAAIRGAVGKSVRACARSLTGDPVRVFVSAKATVSNGRIRTSAIEVQTSAATPSDFAACVTRELAAVSIHAPAGDSGSFPATVSLLSRPPVL